MRSVAIELSRELPAPRATVWELITDWETQPDWMLEMESVRVLTAQREGVGVEAEAVVRIAGIRTRDRVRVVEWEPPEHLAIAHMGWVKGRGDLCLSASGPASTRIDWREDLVPPLGLMGEIGLRIFKPLMRRVFARDLRILESLVRVKLG